MTPEELEKVRERCKVEGRICLEANKSCSPELWESVLAAPRDRFDLLAHIDAQGIAPTKSLIDAIAVTPEELEKVRKRAKNASMAVYLVCEVDVARDIANILNTLLAHIDALEAEIKRLTDRVRELEEEIKILKQIRDTANECDRLTERVRVLSEALGRIHGFTQEQILATNSVIHQANYRTIRDLAALEAAKKASDAKEDN